MEDFATPPEVTLNMTGQESGDSHCGEAGCVVRAKE